MITLVTGSNGQLGKTIQSIVKNNGEFIFTDINSLDITKKKEIELFIKSYEINCIVNCAAYTHVDQAEIEKVKADEINCNAVKYYLYEADLMKSKAGPKSMHKSQHATRSKKEESLSGHVKHEFRGSTTGAPSSAFSIMLLMNDHHRCITSYLGN